MLFDGECIFCCKAIQFFIRIDKRQVLRYTTLQSAEGKTIKKKLGLSDVMESVILIDKGEYLMKSDVTFRVFKYLNQPWKALSVLRYIPLFIRDFFYDLIARNRYKIFGKQDQCFVPSPVQKNLFINDNS